MKFSTLQPKPSHNLELVGIHYDLDTLQVIIKPAEDAPSLKVTFSEVEGFRVLDEGNLLEFWSEINLTKGWLYQIHSSGWLEQEQQRPGFLLDNSRGLKEFLVIGIDQCISVLAYQPPKIYQA